jgi:hypothetical protein
MPPTVLAFAWFLLPVAIWLSIYLVRKKLPMLWAVPALLWLRDEWKASAPPWAQQLLDLAWHVWQGLPSVLLGAAFGAVTSGGDIALAMKGALYGALAPVLHLALKHLPGAYRGALALRGTPLTAWVLIGLSPALIRCAAQQIPEDRAERARYFADAVVEGVKMRDAVEAQAIAKLRAFCSGYREYVGFLPQPIPEADEACRRIETPAPAPAVATPPAPPLPEGAPDANEPAPTDESPPDAAAPIADVEALLRKACHGELVRVDKTIRCYQLRWEVASVE